MSEEGDIYENDYDFDFESLEEEEEEGIGSGLLEEIISQGFPAPAGSDDDPFSAKPTQDSPTERTSIKTESKNQGTEPKEVSNKPKVVKNAKTGMFKGKPFKNLKHKTQPDNESLDPEEERLKILPECCEFTARRNDAFEDESRREMSTAWYGEMKMTKAQQKQLCFSESLLIVEETGAVIGKMYCSVTFSKFSDKECFCVHAGSFGKFSTGLETGTSITSFVNFDLTTLQEFVHEWASKGKDTIERKTFVMNEWNSQPCKITLTRNGKLVDGKSVNLGFKDRENLVLEGANLILLRLLILERRTIGNMTLQALSYTGKVVKAKYEELGSGWENVKGKQMKTWGIRRTTCISEDEKRTWDSLFNKNARLILRCQPESNQALIPLWFESIIDFDKNGNFIGSYSPYAWACDMELYTKFTLKKNETTYDHRRYILDHPEIKALLSDYLQALLFRKPRDVIEFTQQYFESFLSLRGKTPRRSLRKEESTYRTGTYYSYGSFTSMPEDVGEGEWFGDGEDTKSTSNFYSINPKAGKYDILNKPDDANVNTTESERGGPSGLSGNETEDDLIVNEQGNYIPKKSAGNAVPLIKENTLDYGNE